MKLNYFLILLFLTAYCNMKSQVYAASNFTMLSLTDPEVGVNVYNDKYSACWGWTQPVTHKEYAIACSKSGTYWVDVTNPASPTISAFAAGTSTNGVWRETKTYQNYCYVISDDNVPNTFQIFDMSPLPTTVTTVYNSQALFKRAHTLWVDGNKLYVAGVTYSNNTTSSMDVYSLATPSAPVLLRQLKQDYNFVTYVHDMFVRNDTVFASCGNQGLFVFKFNTGTNTFTQLGSLTTYTAQGYNHSTAWTPNGKTIVMTDEVPASLPIKIVDVTNIANMQVIATTNQFAQTTPHNPYLVDNKYCFMSSYQDGTQLYDISTPSVPVLAGFFDTFYQGGGNNNNWTGDNYDGQWAMYPYFPSKNIFALDQKNGIFMLSTHLYANPKINLQGNGNNITDGAVTTSTVNSTDFGTVTIPGNSSNTFVIQNSGIGTLTVSGISLTGTNASDFSFSVTPATPFTVAPSGSKTFTLQFTPSAAGTRTAMVTINSNDLYQSVYNFVISGSGHIIPTGLNSLKRQVYNVTLFPDPAQYDVQFNVPLNFQNKEIQIKVFNTEGKLVSEKSGNEILKNNNIIRTVNVSELSNGLYYFNISSGNNNIITKKLVISK